MSDTTRLKVGVVGLGRIGKIHLENLHNRIAGVQVVAVSDPDIAGQAYAKRLGVNQVYATLEDLLAHPDLEAVAICSPTDLHATQVMAAAKAGKAIFCEKPLDLALPTVKQVLEVVAEQEVPLMIGFNRRFDPHFTRLKQGLVRGDIGQAHLVRITSRDPAPPPISYIQSSGGLFLDMAIHDFDIARFLIGHEVESVFVQASNRLDPAIGEAGDVDTAITLLRFTDQSLVCIDNSRQSAYGYDQRIEVFGSGGMLQVENVHQDLHRLYNAEGEHGPPFQHFFLERYQAAYIAEMAAFVSAVRYGEAMPVQGSDGLAAMRIALAANLSLQEARLVRLAEIS